MKLGDRWKNEKIDRTRENPFEILDSFDVKTQKELDKILDKLTEIYRKDMKMKADIEKRCFEYFGYSWDWLMSHTGSVCVKTHLETNKNVYQIDGKTLFSIQTIFDDPRGVYFKIQPEILERYILEGRKDDDSKG